MIQRKKIEEIVRKRILKKKECWSRLFSGTAILIGPGVS
jgi:hypothetical protein